jgi:hypothetical protein
MADLGPLDRPRNLAGDYLRQAAEALHAACDPEHLYKPWRPDQVRHGLGWAVMRKMAAGARFESARTSALFSALSAEALINEYLAAVAPSKSKLKQADRRSTVKKYTEVSAEFAGEPLFPEGDAVITKLEQLFELRHKLVHPKPGLGQGPLLDAGEPELEEMFPIADLADYIVIVGAAGTVIVNKLYGPTAIDVPGTMLWHAREAVFGLARRGATMPEPDAPGETSIWNLVGDYLDQRRKRAE